MAKISAHKIKRYGDNGSPVWIGSKKYSNDTLDQHRNLSWGKTSFKLLGINFDVDLDKIVNINYNENHQYLYYPVS
jgi:hypothetical protein